MTLVFDLIFEDFVRELGTIRQLLASCSAPTATLSVRTASSNASILLLGASYEEFTRECVREYAQGLIIGDPPLNHIPAEFARAVWDRVIFVLRGSSFGDSRFDVAEARSLIDQLQRFCLDQNRSAAVADTVAYNQNNLRPKEVNVMFKRVGIQDCCRALGERLEMIAFFGSPDGASAHGRMVAFVNDFYDVRNEVAHSIGSRKISGALDLGRYLDFFEIFAELLVKELNELTTI